jgi:hypothetical protein
VAAGENRAPTPIMAYDGGVYMLYLVEGIVIATCLLVLGGRPPVCQRHAKPDGLSHQDTGLMFVPELRDKNLAK